MNNFKKSKKVESKAVKAMNSLYYEASWRFDFSCKKPPKKVEKTGQLTLEL